MVWSLASVELFLASERNNTLTLSGSLLTPSTAEHLCYKCFPNNYMQRKVCPLWFFDSMNLASLRGMQQISNHLLLKRIRSY